MRPDSKVPPKLLLCPQVYRLGYLSLRDLGVIAIFLKSSQSEPPQKIDVGHGESDKDAMGLAQR
jgi:hypothetical protein